MRALKAYGWLGSGLHLFLTLEIDGGKSSAIQTGTFTPGEGIL
jgi:hypothetical protein